MIPVAMKLQMSHRWDLRTPVMIRYMPCQFIDDFFATGRLRLSSFVQFSKHKDEQRRDNDEGFTILTGLGDKDAVIAAVRQGQQSFVLCGSTREDQDLMASFQCDAYFRIQNTFAFARLVAAKVPGFIAGIEGHCIYTGVRAIRKRIVFSAEELQASPDGTPPSEERLRDVLSRMSDTPDAYLLKNHGYASQCEYRIVWHTSALVPDYITIECPEAVQYCERP